MNKKKNQLFIIARKQRSLNNEKFVLVRIPLGKSNDCSISVTEEVLLYSVSFDKSGCTPLDGFN